MPAGNREVVRLTTATYTGSGKHSGCFSVSKHLRVMRRLSHGHGLLEESIHNIGTQETLDSIVNLDSCEDGLYEVAMCNVQRSWETPHIVDNYDLKLIPFNQAEPL